MEDVLGELSKAMPLSRKEPVSMETMSPDPKADKGCPTNVKGKNVSRPLADTECGKKGHYARECPTRVQVLAIMSNWLMRYEPLSIVAAPKKGEVTEEEEKEAVAELVSNIPSYVH